MTSSRSSFVLEDAVCGGGQPRLFVAVDGTYHNTFDGNDEGDCGQLTDGLGSSTSGTVVSTYDGEAGTIGHAGIVFDNVADRGTATIADVVDRRLRLVLDDEPDDDDGDGNGAPKTKDELRGRGLGGPRLPQPGSVHPLRQHRAGQPLIRRS